MGNGWGRKAKGENKKTPALADVCSEFIPKNQVGSTIVALGFLYPETSPLAVLSVQISTATIGDQGKAYTPQQEADPGAKAREKTI